MSCDQAGNCTDVSATYTHSPPPPVVVESVNPGSTLARELCLRIAVGPAEAECGDLRLAHALPGTTTMNRARAPILTYSSAHADPRPLIAALVTMPHGIPTADSVRATVSIDGAVVTRAWSAAGWQPGVARRVVVDLDAKNTGAYSYSLEVVVRAGRQDIPFAPVHGRVAVVNRTPARSAPAGGSPASSSSGSRPTPSFGSAVNGSTREYVRVGSTDVWRAPSVTRPDSITRAGSPQVYTRHAGGGLRVRFDAAGRHVATDNRQDHRTSFEWDGALLQRIVLPLPTPATTHRYDFGYSGEPGVLTSVLAVAGGTARSVTIAHVGSTTRVASIQDPDPAIPPVRFGYNGAGTRITSRTDRRGTITGFAYDAGGKLASVTVDPAGLALTTTIHAQETRGLAPVAVDTSAVYTFLDGPRPDSDVLDHSRFWLDRFGAPRRIRGESTLAGPPASWFGSLIGNKTDGSGLQYMRNRSYDPKTGRFTQEDPIGLAGGMNLYGFAGGDPINYWDPFGLCPQSSLRLLNRIRRACETKDEAAVRGIDKAQRTRSSLYGEFGGEIVADPNGGFRYTGPRRGGRDRFPAQSLRSRLRGGLPHTSSASGPGCGKLLG